MQCEKCKGEKATVFLTQIVGGQMYKVDLCERCAKNMGVLDASNFSLADMLLNMEKEKELAASEEGHCPDCGFSEEDFRKSGRLGCPGCYEFFNTDLKEILSEMQKSGKHTGKIPEKSSEAIKIFEEVTQLRKELEAAVQEENYEQAARLRDRLKAFESIDE
ncbi:MAG: UvrB/UvrC motif-containing protein [Verrucomicrobiota bacterium]